MQKLDPPGVGARDLSECLLLQLTPETPHRDVLRVLILNHLEDIRTTACRSSSGAPASTCTSSRKPSRCSST